MSSDFTIQGLTPHNDPALEQDENSRPRLPNKKPGYFSQGFKKQVLNAKPAAGAQSLAPIYR